MGRKNTFYYRARYVLEWMAVWWVKLWCRILPRPVALIFLRPLALMAWLLDGRHRRSIMHNIALAFPDYSRRQVKNLAWKTYTHLTRCVVDFVNMDKITPENWMERCSYRNPEIVDEVLKENKGAILATGHFGLWELNGHLTNLRWPPFTVIGRPMDNPYIHEYVFAQRQSGGMKCLDKIGSMLQLLKIIKKNGRIGVLLDQDGGRDGVYVKLFGQLCSTHYSMAQLSLRTGTPMILVCGYYESDGYRYVLWPKEKIELPEDERTGDPDVDLLLLVQKQNDAIERAVREHPEQWLWMHHRFRRKPRDGSRILLDDGSVVVKDGDEMTPIEEYRRKEKGKKREVPASGDNSGGKSDA